MREARPALADQFLPSVLDGAVDCTQSMHEASQTGGKFTEASPNTRLFYCSTQSKNEVADLANASVRPNLRRRERWRFALNSDNWCRVVLRRPSQANLMACDCRVQVTDEQNLRSEWV